MDLAKDMLNLAEKVARVPGLVDACSLAIEIIKTVQISKNNTARLQYLAHFVTDHLVSISEIMAGRWDNASAKVKEHLDEFEAILLEILKTVTKQSKSSRVIALVTAGDIQMDIKGIEKRLNNIQSAISFFVGLNTAIAVNNIQENFYAQQAIGLDAREELRQVQRVGMETRSAVIRLANSFEGGHKGLGFGINDHDTELRTYTREDVRLLRLISRNCHHFSWDQSGVTVTVNLYQADLSDGKIVLVKIYESPDLTKTKQAFIQDLEIYKSIWDLRLIQVIGFSRSVAKIPFQVYHSPQGKLEPFWVWWTRTCRFHQLETIFGLYEMRKSIRALLEFRQQRRVDFGTMMLWGCLVNVQFHEDRHHWNLLYSKDFKDFESGSFWSQKICQTIPGQYLGLDHVGDYSSTNIDPPGVALVAGFAHKSSLWVGGIHELDAIIRLGLDTTNLSALGAALFDNGLLGACSSLIRKSQLVIGLGSIGRIGLGDVGYMTNNRAFIIIDNFHTRLTSTNAGVPSWEATDNLDHREMFSGQSGISCTRYKVPINREHPHYRPDHHLHYTNLNERHAWEVLQAHACEVVACHGLTIQPHELRLITSVNISWTMDVRSPRRSRIQPHYEGGSRGPGQYGILSESPSNPRFPTVYTFARDSHVHTRVSAAPEISSIMRASFQEEPAWLNDEDVWETHGDIVVRDGFKLEYELTQIRISYLQLPVGVAHPYITQVDEP